MESGLLELSTAPVAYGPPRVHFPLHSQPNKDRETGDALEKLRLGEGWELDGGHVGFSGEGLEHMSPGTNPITL